MNKAIMAALAASTLLVGCGDETTPPTVRPAGSMSMVGYDAELIKARATIQKVDETLRPIGEPVFSDLTDDYGLADASGLNLADQYLLVKIGQEGFYYEEATGKRIELRPTDVLTSLVYYRAGDDLKVTASGFTSLATAYAQCLVSQYGENPTNAMNYATSAFSAMTNVDIFTTKPVNPSLASATGLGLNKDTGYGMLHAGVSMMMKNIAESQGIEAHTSNYRSIDFYNFAVKDILEDSACALDGVIQDADGNRVELGLGTYKFSENTYRVQSARQTLEFARSSANLTAITDVDFLPWANALANAENARLFNGLAPVPLDDVGPEITLAYPQGHYFGGVTDYKVDVADFSGVREVEIFVNGSSLGKKLNESSPVFSINTQAFADGDTELKIVATDNGFITSEKTHNIVIWNASPIAALASPKHTRDLAYEAKLSFSGPVNVTHVTIGGVVASIVDNIATATVALTPGVNDLPFVATNALGQVTDSTVKVYVDRVAPRFSSIASHNEAYYSPNENVWDSYLARLNFDGGITDPIYFQDSNVAMNGKAVTTSNLANGKFAFLDFRVTDDSGSQPVELITATKDIKVTFSYHVNNVPVFENKVLSPRGAGVSAGDYILPFVEEYLGNNWFLTEATDDHRVRVHLEDNAGNVAIEDFVFKARYFAGGDLFVFRTLESRYSQGSMFNLPSVGDAENLYEYEFRNTYDFPISISTASQSQAIVEHHFMTGQMEAKVIETTSNLVRYKDDSGYWKDADKISYATIDGRSKSLASTSQSTVVQQGHGSLPSGYINEISCVPNCDDLKAISAVFVSKRFESHHAAESDYYVTHDFYYANSTNPNKPVIRFRKEFSTGDYYYNMAGRRQDIVGPYFLSVMNSFSRNVGFEDHIKRYVKKEYAFETGFPRANVNSQKTNNAAQQIFLYSINGSPVNPDLDGFVNVPPNGILKVTFGTLWPAIEMKGGDCYWVYPSAKSCDQQLVVKAPTSITYKVRPVKNGAELAISEFTVDRGLVVSAIQ